VQALGTTEGLDHPPTWRAYREQTACGMMSPKMTMRTVETKKPTRPLVRSERMMLMSELTAMLAMRRVHSRRLPSFRIGAIRRAHLEAHVSPASITTSRPIRSRPMKPSVRPAKAPERARQAP
jgi:hypothetical protein